MDAEGENDVAEVVEGTVRDAASLCELALRPCTGVAF